MMKLLNDYGWALLSGCLLAIILVNQHVISSKDNSNLPLSFSYAVSKAAPSVVNIYTTKRIKVTPKIQDPFFNRFLSHLLVPQQRIESSLGSGVIIDQNGYIVTALHVINKADQIWILLADGRETDAEIVGIDNETDLAVLKVPLKELPVITTSNSNHSKVGDIVLAIGNPLGIGQAVSQGIISGLNKVVIGLNSSDVFIQTDAALNRGGSGGALVDIHGHLLGINTRIVNNAVGIGFATPVTKVIKVLRQIINEGEVRRGWLGFNAAFIASVELSKSIQGYQGGLYITSIIRDGPSDKAGLLPHDIIIEIEGKLLPNVTLAKEMVSETSPGQTLNLKVLRDNKVLAINIQTIKQP